LVFKLSVQCGVEGCVSGLRAAARKQDTQLVLQLVKKFPAFFGTRRFITVPSSARHPSLSRATSIHSPQLPPTSWRSILILSSHLRLGLPNGLLIDVIIRNQDIKKLEATCFGLTLAISQNSFSRWNLKMASVRPKHVVSKFFVSWFLIITSIRKLLVVLLTVSPYQH
jgi:hypothetical protein